MLFSYLSTVPVLIFYFLKFSWIIRFQISKSQTKLMRQRSPPKRKKETENNCEKDTDATGQKKQDAPCRNPEGLVGISHKPQGAKIQIPSLWVSHCLHYMPPLI